MIGLGNYWSGSSSSPGEARNVMMADFLLVGAVVLWGAYLTLSKPTSSAWSHSRPRGHVLSRFLA